MNWIEIFKRLFDLFIHNLLIDLKKERERERKKEREKKEIKLKIKIKTINKQIINGSLDMIEWHLYKWNTIDLTSNLLSWSSLIQLIFLLFIQIKIKIKNKKKRSSKMGVMIVVVVAAWKWRGEERREEMRWDW